MFSLVRKTTGYFTYGITKPAKDVWKSARSIAHVLQQAADRSTDDRPPISLDGALAHQKEIAAFAEARSAPAIVASRRTALLFFVVFVALAGWGFYRFVAGLMHRDIVTAKAGCSDLLVGVFVAAGSFLWLRSLRANGILPTMETMLKHCMRIKRLLIVLSVACLAVSIVNAYFLRIMPTILSFAALTLCAAWLLRFSLRVWQLQNGQCMSVRTYIKQAGFLNLFDLHL